MENDTLMYSRKRKQAWDYIFERHNLPDEYKENIIGRLFLHREMHIYAVIPSRRKNMEEQNVRHALLAMSDLRLCYYLIAEKCYSPKDKLINCWHFFEELESFISETGMSDYEKTILKGICLQEFAGSIFSDKNVKVAYWSNKDIVKKYNDIWLQYEKIIEMNCNDHDEVVIKIPSKKDKVENGKTGWIIAVIVFLFLVTCGKSC